jgi:Cu/Ag efflux pump CusA
VVRVNGQPNTTYKLVIDGQDATNSNASNVSGHNPSVEAVEEFTLQTSNYAAEFGQIAGVTQMTSTSTLGSTSITLQFTLDRNIDAAAQDVQAMIAKTLKDLPQGIIPPSYNKVNPADQPILYLAMTSKTLPLWTLDEYAETRVAPFEPVSSIALCRGTI